MSHIALVGGEKQGPRNSTSTDAYGRGNTLALKHVSNMVVHMFAQWDRRHRLHGRTTPIVDDEGQ
ncbi:hypothetical protein N7457_002654 [Penicillium paradoxum]|uniref:uncharacterized protein n=1 Tax=Penicillium paradoxum TaxID=176176 RepID=UPI002548885D|nr:uncharacterized protein N7457_002654 [Penicillium paradoxum]KAJ5787664.1 hypothetical protein N7457_002654 [Penicillium paradoxum]